MARVKVSWTETTRYEQEFEIDGFYPVDAETADHQMKEAIIDGADYTVVHSVDAREIDGYEIVREGEGTPEVPEAKRGEEGFDF